MADLISMDYAGFLADLQRRIRTAQTKAALSVNRELIALYFDIGRLLVEKQETHKWGDAVITQLARDLKREFPALTGFGRANLFSMRRFFLAYRDAGPIVQQTVGQPQLSHSLWDNLQLCHRLWHKSLGATTSSCWRKKKTRRNGCGMPKRHWRMAGRARC